MSGCGGRRISVQAALAQLGERQTEDLKVPGSIPGGGTLQNTSPMAQSVARQAVNLQVAGSNPAGGGFYLADHQVR